MNGFVPFSVIVVVKALEDRAVDQKTFNVVASVIFALVALLLFSVATTIRSMLSPKASPGVANNGVARR